MNTSWSKMRREKSMLFLLLLILTQTPFRPSRTAIGRTGGHAKRCWWIRQALISKYRFDFLFFSCQLWRGEIIPSGWKVDCFYFRSVSILPSSSWPMRYGFLPALSFLVKSRQKILKTQEAGMRAINNLAMSKMSEIKIQTWLFLDTLERSFPAPTCRMEKCIWNEFQIYSVSLELPVTLFIINVCVSALLSVREVLSCTDGWLWVVFEAGKVLYGSNAVQH